MVEMASPGFILVEGSADLRIIAEICEKFEIDLAGCIDKCESDAMVLKKFKSYLKSELKPRFLGIVLDVDNHDIQRRWNQIRNALDVRKEYALPVGPNPAGTILESANTKLPRIGVWLMPDNMGRGSLEDFLLRISEERLCTQARDCVQSVLDQRIARFRECHKSKAIVATYLAWQESPGASFEVAFKAGAFTVENDICRNFAEWIRNLLK